MVDWARRAEERGFATLGTIDRLVYPTYDTLTALAAAAGATTPDRAVHRHPAGAALPAGVAGQGDRQPATRSPAAGSPSASGSAAGPTTSTPMDRPYDAPRPADGRDAGPAASGLGRRAGGRRRLPGGRRRCRGSRVPVLVGGSTRRRRSAARSATATAGPSGGGARGDGRRWSRRSARPGGRPAGRASRGSPRWSTSASATTTRPGPSLRNYYGFLGEWAEQIAQAAVRTPEQTTGLVRAVRRRRLHRPRARPDDPALDQVDRLADVVL